MLHPTAYSSDLILLNPPSHTTAQSLSPGTSQHLQPHSTYAKDTLCANMRAIQNPLSKIPSVSSRTTCPVQHITSVDLDAPSLMLTTYMEPLHVSWSLHQTHPHGSHRTHPWNFSGTTPGSAASHSRKTSLKETLSVKTPPRPRQHPLPPHRQHRFPQPTGSSLHSTVWLTATSFIWGWVPRSNFLKCDHTHHNNLLLMSDTADEV